MSTVANRSRQYRALQSLRRLVQRRIALAKGKRRHPVARQFGAELLCVPRVIGDFPNLEDAGEILNCLADESVIDIVPIRQVNEFLLRPDVVGNSVANASIPEVGLRQPEVRN